MHELFALFVSLALLGLLFAPIVLSILALRRARRLELRIRRLELAGKREAPPVATAPRVEPVVPPAPATPPPAAVAPAPAPVAQDPAPLPQEPVAHEPVAHKPGPVEPTPRALEPAASVASGGPASAPPKAFLAAEPRPPAPSARDRLSKIDWERWVGLRGAAVLGAVFLGIAGILLFQYSIQRNLITPQMRVGMGIGAGLLGLVGSEVLRRKAYLMTANALAAGSIVVLYAAFWAGHYILALYALKVAFVLMAAVTAVCCLLSSRNRSQLIAVLGLLGGFATPLLLMSSLDNPVGLFGYLLLLNLGFLFVGQRRGWSSMGLIGILGTALIEAVWIGRKLDVEHVTFGLAVLGVFAVLFAVAGSGSVRQKARWFQSQAAGVLMPFLFAGYFATRVEMGPHLVPMAGLAALLSLAAAWVARREGASWLPLGAASGSVALVMVWLFSTVPDVDGSRALLFVGVTLGLALLFHAFVEWPVKESENAARIRRGHAAAAAFANGGMLLAVIFAGVLVSGVGVWPWIAALVAIVLINARLAAKSGLAPLQLAGGLGLAIGLSCLHAAQSTNGSFPSVEGYYGVLLGGGALLGLLALRPGGANAAQARWAWISTGCYALLAMSMLVLSSTMFRTEPELVLGATLLFGLGAAYAASRARTTWLFAAAALVTAVFQTFWIGERFQFVENGDKLLIAFVPALLTSAGFVLVPVVFRAAFGRSGWAHRVGALSAWLWFFALVRLYDAHFGDGAAGVLPLVLAVAPALGALRSIGRTANEGEAAALPVARAWYLGVAASFVCLALPHQIDEKVVPIALCLFGAAAAFLWQRLRHHPLLVPAVVATGLGTLLLCGTAVAPRAFERSDAIFVNLISYVYLLPAAAALLVIRFLTIPADSLPEDGAEAKPPMWRRLLPYLRGVAGFAAIALVFAWISLTIFNAWGTDHFVVVTFRRLQARDLVLSISWAVYALCLLGLGMGRRLGALRWVSLGLLLVTIGKVFLFDLGNLGGLYRVGSMFGLAMSLLLVSFLYQRFVFRAARTA